MKTKLAFCLLFLLAFALTLTISARPRWGGDNDGRQQGRDNDDYKRGRDDDDRNISPLKLLSTIAIPGKPIASTDIADINQQTKMLFFADRSNAAIEVIDAANDLFLGRITAGAGGLKFAGGSGATEGPNGVVATPDKKVWAGDNGSVKVADVDPNSPTYLQIIASISTVTSISGSACTTTCDRADEIAYDPDDNIIVADNDEPGGGALQPYSTFINASPPYNVLGQINYATQGLVAKDGLEQPLWDAGIHRFLQTLPVVTAGGTGAIAVINPKTMVVERVISLAGFHCSPSGEALGENQHLIVACPTIVGGTSIGGTSAPLVIDVTTGEELGAGITQIGSGDEVYYNPGDDRFLVSANVNGLRANPTVLGVINAKSGNWLQNLPVATLPSGVTPGSGGLATSGRAGNLAALGYNNHVFVIVNPAASPATDICGFFVTTATPPVSTDYGCVAVFGPVNEDQDHRW